MLRVPSSYDGAVLAEARGGAGPGDAEGSSGFAVDHSQPAVTSLPSGTDAVGGGAGAADLPGPLRFEFEPGAGYFELGFLHWPDRYGLDVFSDEVAVRTDSVLVRDGAVRGLVQNMSQRLFTRGVAVSVGDGRWVFPLTVQPSEVVPFVIEGYEGHTDPEMVGFEVAAEFVAEPDPRRSFYVSGLPGQWAEPWGELRERVRHYADVRPAEGTFDDDLVRVYETSVRSSCAALSSQHCRVAVAGAAPLARRHRGALGLRWTLRCGSDDSGVVYWWWLQWLVWRRWVWWCCRMWWAIPLRVWLLTAPGRRLRSSRPWCSPSAGLQRLQTRHKTRIGSTVTTRRSAVLWGSSTATSTWSPSRRRASISRRWDGSLP